MNRINVGDDYQFERNIPSFGDKIVAQSSMPHLDPSKSLDTEVFFAKAVACGFECEVVHAKPGNKISLPKSEFGKTSINYAGNAPELVIEPDRFGNLQLKIAAGSVVEIIFNREQPGAHGKNRGAHGKKIVYIA